MIKRLNYIILIILFTGCSNTNKKNTAQLINIEALNEILMTDSDGFTEVNQSVTGITVSYTHLTLPTILLV